MSKTLKPKNSKLNIINLLMVLGIFVFLTMGCSQINDAVNGNKTTHADAAANTNANSNASSNVTTNSNANANSFDSNKSADNTSANNEAELEKGKSKDRIAQKKTTEDIRNVATAMFSWLTDQVGWNIYPKGIRPRSSKDSAIRASLRFRLRDAQNVQTEPLNPMRLNYIPIQSKNTIDMKDYVRISLEELKKVLVPKYLVDIPEKDGWGHPYEFYLNTKNFMGPKVMGIRSPGRDGKYQDSTVYQVESFPADNFDEDIVWIDGFFVRWAAKQPES